MLASDACIWNKRIYLLEVWVPTNSYKNISLIAIGSMSLSTKDTVPYDKRCNTPNLVPMKRIDVLISSGMKNIAHIMVWSEHLWWKYQRFNESNFNQMTLCEIIQRSGAARRHEMLEHIVAMYAWGAPSIQCVWRAAEKSFSLPRHTYSWGCFYAGCSVH